MPCLYVFCAGVVIALAVAARDCALWPRQAAQAWRAFQPVVLILAWIAFAFLAANLVRFGVGEGLGLADRAIRLLVLAGLSAAFYCSGAIWIARAGRVGLYQRFRRCSAGLQTASPWRAAWETLLLTIGIVFLSLILWLLFKPASPLSERLRAPDHLDVRSGYLLVMFLVAAPLWEEITFRWYLLNRLEEAMAPRPWGRAAAIILCSALWALPHAAWTDPAWVKLVQIFTVGCLLAWRFPVIGLSGCLIAHLVLNSLAVLLWLRPP